jgi:hypothetical protein
MNPIFSSSFYVEEDEGGDAYLGLLLAVRVLTLELFSLNP